MNREERIKAMAASYADDVMNHVAVSYDIREEVHDIIELAFGKGAEQYRAYLAGIPWDEALHEIAGVEPKRKQSPWISVEERLPDNSDEVLTIICYRGRQMVMTNRYEGDRWKYQKDEIFTILG